MSWTQHGGVTKWPAIASNPNGALIFDQSSPDCKGADSLILKFDYSFGVSLLRRYSIEVELPAVRQPAGAGKCAVA